MTAPTGQGTALPPDASVPRLADLPPVRREVIRALLHARAAREVEDRRAAAGLMAPDELAAYRDRRRTVHRVLDRAAQTCDRKRTTGLGSPVVDHRRPRPAQVR